MDDGSTAFVADWHVKRYDEGAEVKYESGSSVVFDKENGVYKAPKGCFDILTFVDNKFTLKMKDNTVYTYGLKDNGIYKLTNRAINPVLWKRYRDIFLYFRNYTTIVLSSHKVNLAICGTNPKRAPCTR